MKRIALAVLTSAVPLLGSAQPLFTNVTTAVFPGLYYGSVAWGDYDNDGYLDILLAGWDGSPTVAGYHAQVWHNQGNGSFVNIGVPLTGVVWGNATWGDYDHDGYLDFLLAGYTGYVNSQFIPTYISEVWHNQGNGSFSRIDPHISGLPGVEHGSVAWGDFDNDGKPDVLITGYDGTNYIAQVWRNLGNGVFTNMHVPLPGVWYSSAAWGDYDNDGYLDILLAGTTNGIPADGQNIAQVWRNLGNGTFTNINAGLPGANNSVAWADMDNDGKLDIVLGDSFVPTLQLWRNMGNGTFQYQTSAKPFTVSERVDFLAIGDYDNDGYLDIVWSGAESNALGTVQLWRNLGNWTFTNVGVAFPGVDYGWVACGDFDNDGRLDVALMGSTGSNYLTQVWRNLNPRTNTVPTAPTTLTSVVTGNGVRLGWNAATDAQTPSNGLSYNIRVGTSPGASDIVGPQANSASGFRRVPALGNAGERLFALVTNLAGSTTYYWSVQAIDTAWAGGPFAGEGTFTTPAAANLGTTLPTGSFPSVAWADFDNDGKLDILFTGGGVSQVWRNLGGGVFTNLNVALTGVEQGSVAVADFDGDGKLDILLTGSSFPGVVAQVWRNLGNGVFTNINAGLPGVFQSAVAVGDLDNDGQVDILLTGGDDSARPMTLLYRNLGSGVFTNILVGLPAVSGGSVALADFDGDGLLDILLTGYANTGAVAQIWHNLGNWTFTNINAGLPGLSASSVAVGDFDNDGKPDILLCGVTNAYTDEAICQVWRNLGNNVFSNLDLALPRIAFGSVAWGDFDNDGRLDILLSGSTNGQFASGALCQVWRNMGNGTFSNLNVGLPGVVWSSVAWGDMDNDGRLDMLITGSGATSLVSQVWQNLTPLANSPPAAPNGLSALVTSNSVLLSWNPASDAQTPAMGLSYNLRVGTTPGGGDIVSANSDPATGLRRVAQLGNCGERLFAVVTNLSVGTNYYWSVQAVDTSFAGSAFATERNFNLNVPEVVTLPASDITSTSAALNGSLTFNNQNTATWFQYGTTTNYGGTTPLTYVSSSTPNQALSSLITGLLRGTLYHYRIVATNSEGTGFGSDLTFTTSTPFTNIASALPAVAFGSAAWADFDNDGKLDLVLTGLGTNGSPISQVWRNLGNGAFTNLNLPLPGVFYSSVACGDFDNDGNLDILLAGYTPAPICQVWRNLGNGSFTNINAGLPGLYYGSVAWGDFDNDGKVDILLTGTTNGNASGAISQIWRNLGNGTFSNINATLPGVYESSVALADFDNDGKLDILLAGILTNGSTDVCQVWRNLGNGIFTNINAGLGPIYYGSAAWGDFDNDGWLDILITGAGLSAIWRNQGNGSFANINAGLPGVQDSWAPCGDMDNDGKLDFLLTGLIGAGPALASETWQNLGGGNFTNLSSVLPGVHYGSSAFGDFYNEGKLGLLLTGSDTNNNPISGLWRNLTPLTNNVPVAPTGLSAVVTSNGVVLGWNPASDAQTPAAGLSYNIRVGTTPGGVDVVSPASDPVTGFRRLTQLGNAGERLTALVTNLTRGTTYYWSVQAVDTSFAGSAFAAEQTFTTPAPFVKINTTIPAVSFGLVAWCDFDNDGRLDLLVSGQTNGPDGTCQLWRNIGGGAFNNIGIGLPGFQRGSVAWGDFNNDGNLDILLAGQTNGDFSYGKAQVWRNLGGSGFTNINAPLPDVGYSSAAWGDFDNDGKLDLLVAGLTEQVPPVSQVWRNLGNDAFTNINVPLPGVYYSSVALGDFDNDGRLDILLTGQLGQGLVSQVWRNLGNGVFTNINVPLPGLWLGSAAWGDFDNDGYLDILITGANSNGVFAGATSQIWRNLGNGTFTNINAGLPGVDYSSVAVGDFDNDGKLDILLTGTTNGSASGAIAQVWRNLGNGIFTNIDAGLPGWLSAAVAVGDFDNDGRLDIVVTAGSSSVQLWRNQMPLTNTPPSGPGGLTAQVTDTGVMLGWNAATDAQTPSSGLNYNIRVGTSPGGFDVVSPEADPLSGFRRLPAMGNAGERLFATVTNLTPLTKYYWSVQAIDTSFAGSPFAAESTFTIGLPTLYVQLVSGSHVVLEWPAWAANFVLESATTLAKPISWQPVTNVLTATPSWFFVTNNTAQSARFYRLHAQ